MTVVATTDPPGPVGPRIIGNMEAYETDRLGSMLRWAAAYGEIVKFSPKVFIVNSYELAEQVLVRTNHEFAIRENFLQEPVPDEAYKGWMKARSIVLSGMRRSDISPFVARVSQLANAVSSAWEPGSEVAVLPEMERITSAAIAEYCFGPHAADLPARAAHLLDVLIKVIGSPFVVPAWLPTPTRIRINRRTTVFNEAVRAQLRLREEAAHDYHDLAGVLVRSYTNGGRDLDRDHAAMVLIGAMLAAHRVPAAALSWVWQLLADNPSVADRLRVELASVESATVTGGDLLALPFLEAVVKESLRLYPPTWLIERTVVQNCQLGRWSVRPGQTILISPYVLHRNPEVFPDPEGFHPERWIDGERAGGRIPRYAYIPFGAGPRVCLGASLATAEMSAVVATIARSHILRPGSAGRAFPDPRATLTPKGLRMIVDPIL